ncbi:MAG: M20/M25/M40 family metallo-hydrolase [Candidatus Hodarchaeales archaeon]|jgi:hypothetical protein
MSRLEFDDPLWRYWFLILLVLVPTSVNDNATAENLLFQPPLKAYEMIDPNFDIIFSLTSAESNSQSEIKPLWQRVFEEVSEYSYYDFLYTLSETIGPRPYQGSGNDLALDWINSTMQSVSGNTATVELWGEYSSVVGILEGYDPSLTDIIVIGGHMDTVAVSPGADDDGSGTALVLEALRVMSQFRFPRDIYFCAFNAEEIGLFGSQDVAGILNDAGMQVKMMFNADMILWDPVGSGERVYVYGGSNSDENRAAELVQNMSRSYGDGVFELGSGGGGASDHASFRQLGYNALFSIETNFNTANYHTASDTIFHPECNFTMAADVTASFAAAAAKLAFEGVSPTVDYDNDGIPDLIELEIGTDMTNPDTDRDGLTDGEEINTYNTNPLKRDTDDDNLSDGEEIDPYRTDPLNPDSDADSLYDGDEVFMWATDPLDSDSDHDGVSDYNEITIYNTNPNESDSDSDGLPDGWEIQLGTDPGLRDSDQDSIPDGEEVEEGWDPLDPGSPGANKNSSSKDSSSTRGFALPIILLSFLAAICVLKRKKES